jgi:hypothetical protein
VSAPEASTETPRAARSRFEWLLWLALCAAIRLVLILAPADQMNPDAGGVPNAEELIRGVAAQEMLDGPLLPVLDYRVNDFSGGSLVIALIAVPFFALLGPTVVALRLATLPFALLACASAFWMLERYFGRRAARIGAALTACLPPGYALIGSTAYGTHIEASALALFVTYLYLRAREPASSLRWWLGFGVALGITFDFSYATIVLIGALGLFDLLSGAQLVRRPRVVLAVLGFVLGTVPTIVYTATHAGVFAKPYGEPLDEHLAVDGAWTKLLGLFSADLPQGFFFPALGPLTPLWIGRLALIAAFVVVVLALRARATQRTDAGVARLIAIYLVCYAAAFALGDFGVDNRRTWVQSFRYVMPLVLFGSVAVAIALDKLAHRSPRAVLAASITWMCLCAGTTLAAARWRGDLDRPARDDRLLGRFIALRARDDVDKLERIVERLERERAPAVQAKVLETMASQYRFYLRPGQALRVKDQERRLEFIRAAEFLSQRVRTPQRELFSGLLELASSSK